MMLGEMVSDPGGEIKVNFGYQCNGNKNDVDEPKGIDIPDGMKLRRANSSFSCLSGAALSANATLANTNICNNLIGAEILPSLDSPTSFRRIPSSPSLSRLDLLSSSLQSSMSILSCSPSSPNELPESDSFSLKSMSAPSRSDSFLNADEVQVAGGAAGEDRVQAVCSEENGWLFCAVFDGFNGRDAADFLAGTLYETVAYHLSLLDWELEPEPLKASDSSSLAGTISCIHRHETTSNEFIDEVNNNRKSRTDQFSDKEGPRGSFKQPVLDSLQNALFQAENDFLRMVEQEMEVRPDLVSVGSCVLLALLHGKDLYVLNVGDSRAVLATYTQGNDLNNINVLQAVQLTESHTVDNEVEKSQLLRNHPDDPSIIVGGKVKGKLKVTRALGVGYLKKKHLNDALMGILRVRNLLSPPYVSIQPSMSVHGISDSDHFVVLGSDGLFDFFSNDEVVKLVHNYISINPSGDPAKHLVEQLLVRAADCAGAITHYIIRMRKIGKSIASVIFVKDASTCGPEWSSSVDVNAPLPLWEHMKGLTLVLRLLGEAQLYASYCVTLHGFTPEELMSIPAGRRRKYHDDVTAIVIILGTFKRTSKASICL